MIDANDGAKKIGRRSVLLGIGGSVVSACTSNITPTFATLSETDTDPLFAFRILADAGPEEWFKHLHPPQSVDGPCVLALSGGGEDGAFGAGALAGWSATGQRPKFDIVTGVSTGALIAPFAFLGKDYDNILRQLFTESDAGDIARMKPLQAVSGGALYDTTPLADLIKRATPAALLQQVAAQHMAGRRLFVVTSEVDKARAFVWDMGAIAQAGQLDLFRSIIQASAALPGLFPPVTLQYDIDGVAYQETHYDGGVHMQFFAIPSFAFTVPDQKIAGGHVFVLINNTINPAPSSASRSALGISQQALMTMARASALASVQATQLFARENGLKLSVASIDPNADIVYDPSDRFSSEYMNALFTHGYDRATGGLLWDVEM